MLDVNQTCVGVKPGNYSTILGHISMPLWEAVLTIATLGMIVVLTIIGNVLVILSVFTYKPLRIVQNFFIVSLAVADLTVAILVMPLNIAYTILGKWVFGRNICKMWLTLDVLCCTASILNLCGIALDRFWAITDPINYAQKRTLKRVLLMIGGIWIMSFSISSPPLIGWNDWPEPEVFNRIQICKLTERQGYVIYSSLGSFFIPLFIMAVVYVEIFIETRKRLRERAQASKINAISKNQSALLNNKEPQPDRESVSSETNHNEHHENTANGKPKDGRNKKNKKKRKENAETIIYLKPILIHEDSLTDNPETSSISQRRDSNPCTSDHVKITISECTTVSSSPQSKSSNLNKTLIDESAVAIKKPTLVYQFIEEKQRISLSKERRAARTLGIIMGVFVGCWLPFFIMYVTIPFCPTCCPSPKLINFLTWLGYINSVLNPIIYTIFNLDFRRAFRRLLGMQP